MTEKVSIRRQDRLPAPMIHLASAEDLAAWYVSQLAWELEQGQTELSISCFDTAPMGYGSVQAAYAVLRAVTGFLYDHPQAEHLSILCGDDEALQAYSFQWNMWYAEHKPGHGT